MNQQSFFLSVLSESGVPSSKRVITFALLVLWILAFIYNAVTGKSANETYTTQHYLLLSTGIGVIFGSNIIDAVKTVKLRQSDNNKEVNQPSPTPTQTVVTPGADAVVVKP